MTKRYKTSYPGVFFRESQRIAGKGMERVYYVVYKKRGRVVEEKAGRQFSEGMTVARAARFRADRIEGKKPSRKEIREQRAAEKTKWTIAKLFEEYKKQNPTLKGITQDQNRFDKHLEKSFGGRDPKEIIPLDVDRLRVFLGKKYAPATVRNVLELLRRIISFGHSRQLCGGLGFKIKMPPVDNVRTEALSQSELKALLKTLNKEVVDIQGANLMKLCLFTGMRRGELLRLQWEDVNFEQGFIRLRNTKGGKMEVIPLNDSAREVLEDHPRREDSPFVFPGRRGQQRVDVSKAVNRLKTKAGLPKDFRALHGLRHSYASMLASSGQVDLYTLQKLMTHKSPQMVQRYAHLANEALQRAGNVAAGLFSEAGKKKKEKMVNLNDHKKD